MKQALLVTIMWFVSTSAFGSTVLGHGTKSCGTYVSNYNQKDVIEGSAWVAHVAELSWIVGFITGFNFTQYKDLAQGIDVPAIELWIYNYCSANPLESIYEAAGALIIEIEGKAQ